MTNETLLRNSAATAGFAFESASPQCLNRALCVYMNPTAGNEFATKLSTLEFLSSQNLYFRSMERNTKVEVLTDSVLIYNNYGNREIFRIPLEHLGLTSQKGNVIHSFWILYLAQYEGIDMHVLYTLATLIQQRHPQNNINWKLVFFSFEKLDYTVKAQSIKDQLSGTHTTLHQLLQITKEDCEDDLDVQLFMQTGKNLKEYGVLNEE